MNIRDSRTRFWCRGLTTLLLALGAGSAHATLPTPIPEASTLSLLAGGAAAVVVLARWWRRK